MSELLEKIKNVVVNGGHTEIEELVQTGINDGQDLNTIINDGLIAAMDVVGKRFSTGEIFVPEMLVSAVTMKKGLEIIKPLLKGDTVENKATVMICTVKGDMHDIGKNLVSMMMEGAGFKVIGLGVDISVEDLINKIKEENVDFLGLSALLTTTLPEMKRVIDSLEEQNLRDKIKIIVGGAPVDKTFADSIGADGYGEDAVAAVELVKRLVS